MCSRCNDPGLVVPSVPQPSRRFSGSHIGSINVKKTEMKTDRKIEKKNKCILHGAGHPLNACRLFREKSVQERRNLLKENKICFRCCETEAHSFRNCQAVVICKICQRSHPTAMHTDEVARHAAEQSGNGGEQMADQANKISSLCTTLCDGFSGRSCSKTMLVKVHVRPEQTVLVYAMHDDQSNRTLASPALLDKLGVDGAIKKYTLNSCAGSSVISARHVPELCISSADGNSEMTLHNVVECDIPGDRSEIPTPDVTRHYPHLRRLTDFIPPLNEEAEIGLIIGRDSLEAHIVKEQVVGKKGEPFAQRLALGWAIVGEVCLG